MNIHIKNGRLIDPVNNIDAMLDAVREIGWPVDVEGLETELTV